MPNNKDDISFNHKIQRIYKWKKRFGCVSIISGIAIVAITIATSGLVIIPLVIGVYIIANGLMNIAIKID